MKSKWQGKFLMLVSFTLGVSILAVPLLAHHGYAAYETDRKITVTGTVTEWFWANPHCVLQFDATDDKGQVVHWGAETENPTTMTRQGWTKESLKPGDKVTVTMLPVKNGKPIGRILEVALPNGERLAGRVNPATEVKPQDSPK